MTEGIETTGYAPWFHALLQKLGHTRLVGEAATIRAMVVRKTKTDCTALDNGAIHRIAGHSDRAAVYRTRQGDAGHFGRSPADVDGHVTGRDRGTTRLPAFASHGCGRAILTPG